MIRTAHRCLSVVLLSALINILILLSLGRMNRNLWSSQESEPTAHVRLSRFEPDRVHTVPGPSMIEPLTTPQHTLSIPDVSPPELPAVRTDSRVLQRPAITSEPVAEVPAPSPSRASSAGPNGESEQETLTGRAMTGQLTAETLQSHEVDEPPRIVRDRRPPYPADASRHGREGHVTVEIVIDARGRVSEVHVMEQSGPASFTESVMTTARNEWRFAPGMHNGRPVPTRVVRRIYFRLD